MLSAGAKMGDTAFTVWSRRGYHNRNCFVLELSRLRALEGLEDAESKVACLLFDGNGTTFTSSLVPARRFESSKAFSRPFHPSVLKRRILFLFFFLKWNILYNHAYNKCDIYSILDSFLISAFDLLSSNQVVACLQTTGSCTSIDYHLQLGSLPSHSTLNIYMYALH